MSKKVTVISPIGVDAAAKDVSLSEAEQQRDGLDTFNHPRKRRALIISKLLEQKSNDVSVEIKTANATNKDLSFYNVVHSSGLLNFLQEAWNQWRDLGSAGRDPMGFLSGTKEEIPPVVSGNVPLPRDPYQEPSEHVLGQVGYYCTDTCTPVFDGMLEEILRDADCVQSAVDECSGNNITYVLTTHPGHHAAKDSYGGYCYVNHVAALAQHLRSSHERVAILDIDYHAGNGTASIFYNDPSVFVVSLHCDPNYDYPFHSGFEHQTGVKEGEGFTMHLPMPPQTTWENNYKTSLEKAMARITDFGPQALLISLGLDTYLEDPCAIRRAGFCLSGDDYKEMGKTMAENGPKNIPVVFMQEGGYRMEFVGQAATDVVLSFAKAYD